MLHVNDVIYLDHAATTPVDPRVLEAMRPYFCEIFGNPSSRSHSYGHMAADAVEHARGQVAALLHAEARDIYFTSGATESNNLAIKGIAAAAPRNDHHFVTQATEHHAVLDVGKHLQHDGFETTFLGVSHSGRVTAQQVADVLRTDTFLVSIMWANNEIGTVQPIREIAQACHQRGILFHSDATQAVGKLPIDVNADGIDLLSLSAHKLYGPKGVGALFVRHKSPRIRLQSLFDGGGHERGLRSGTLNVPGIVGLGEACRIAQSEMDAEAARLTVLRDRLEAALMSALDGVSLNGDPDHRLPHLSNLCFAGVESEALLAALSDLAVSAGSACTSRAQEASYVLRACGVKSEAGAPLRVSMGRSNTSQQIDYAITQIVQAVKSLRRNVKTAEISA